MEENVIRVNTMLLECVKVLKNVRASEEVKDLLLSVNALSCQVATQVNALVYETQSCPGLYWRHEDAFKARLAEQGAHKKRKVNVRTECRGKKQGALKFDKAGQGPLRDNGPRRLCNRCYQTLVRDQGAGLLKK